jgi:hypothetical protein
MTEKCSASPRRTTGSGRRPSSGLPTGGGNGGTRARTRLRSLGGRRSSAGPRESTAQGAKRRERDVSGELLPPSRAAARPRGKHAGEQRQSGSEDALRVCGTFAAGSILRRGQRIARRGDIKPSSTNEQQDARDGDSFVQHGRMPGGAARGARDRRGA